MVSSSRSRILPARACKKMVPDLRSSDSRASSSTFEKLPTEIFHKIAGQLSDKEVCRLLRTCKVAKLMLEDEHFWLMRFLDHFDEPSSGRSALKSNVRILYKQRMMLLKNISYDDAHALEDKMNCLALSVIKDLMIEAKPVLRPDVGSHVLPCSKNLEFLECVVETTSLLLHIPHDMCTILDSTGIKPSHLSCPEDVRPKKRSKSEKNAIQPYLRQAHARLHTIQLALTAYILDPLKLDANLGYRNLAISQHIAYQAAYTEPVVYGIAFTKVNIGWALHAVNFFRQHALLIDLPLFTHWQDLLVTELPQMWNRCLSDLESNSPVPKIGRVWKGTYAFLSRDEVHMLRAQETPKKYPFDDQNVTNLHPIQTMKLWIPEDGRPTEYLTLWEQILKGKSLYDDQTGPVSKAATKWDAEYAIVRKTVREGTFAYEGIGYDDEQFFCVGHINPLPPQNQMPGFARITMMKYFRTSDGRLDNNIMWAYEGIVLPGGQIMVGRWWAPEYQDPKDEYSGPFIMWCVDQSWDPEERENISDFRGLEPRAGPHDFVAGVNVPNPRH